jgi:ankyrin repeat protein
VTSLTEKTAAFRTKELDRLKHWHQEVSHVDEWRDKGLTALMVIALEFPEEHDLLNALLQDSRELDQIDPGSGSTALHFAAQSGAVECARTLLDAGADPNARDRDGNTPLFRALTKYPWSIDLIKIMMDHKADPDLQNNADSSARLLVETARSNDKDRVLRLLTG